MDSFFFPAFSFKPKTSAGAPKQQQRLQASKRFWTKQIHLGGNLDKVVCWSKVDLFAWIHGRPSWSKTTENANATKDDERRRRRCQERIHYTLKWPRTHLDINSAKTSKKAVQPSLPVCLCVDLLLFFFCIWLCLKTTGLIFITWVFNMCDTWESVLSRIFSPILEVLLFGCFSIKPLFWNCNIQIVTHQWKTKSNDWMDLRPAKQHFDQVECLFSLEFFFCC